MSEQKHSGKHSDSHNKSLFYDTPTSEYPSPNSIFYYNSGEEVADYSIGKKIILDKFFNSVVIYENLCINCAYPLYNKSLIYEHLCSNCTNFESVEKLSSKSKEKNSKNILSNLIGSLKRITSNSSNTTAIKKLEIIHNVDSVFKTNRTFDINEICELKRLSESLETITSPDKNHTSCSKKKKTNTNLISNEDKKIQASNVVDWMTSLRTQPCYYQLTDTENISNVKSIPSKNCFHFSCCSFPSDVTTSMQTSLHSLESVSFFSDISNKSAHGHDDLINEEFRNKVLKFKNNLMDSKKDSSNETQTKNDVKLRSNKRYLNNKHIVNIVGEPSPSPHEYEYNESDSSQSTLDSDFSRQLGLYKSRNRNGFYGKHSSSSEFVNDILTVFDSYLNCDSQTHTLGGSIQLPIQTFESTQTDTEKSDSCNGIESSDSDKNEYTLKCSNYSEFTKTQSLDINELVKNLWLDISLNKIVIYYDDHLKLFLKHIEREKCLDISQLVNLFIKWKNFSDRIKTKKYKRGKRMTVPMISSSTSADSGKFFCHTYYIIFLIVGSDYCSVS